MRTLMTLLLFGCVFCVVSAITGIQSFRMDSRTGTAIWYWHGYGRLYALAYAVGFAAAFYGVYQRYPIVWKLGWIVLFLSAAQFVFEVWRSTGSPSDRFVFTVLSAFGALAIVLYWGSWWRRQKPYFTDLDDEKT